MQPYNSYIMSQNLPTQIMLFIYAFLIFLNLSCAKDTDLFLEAVLEDEEELVETEETSEEQADENTDSGNSSNTDPAPADFQESKPNTIIGTFSPTSAAEISDPSKANYKAIIETSFDCNGCTFAKDLTIEPAGGSISGSAINLNGAFIENNFKQAFSSNISFDNVYVKTRLSPETFGAIANDNTADDIYISALIAQVSYATAQSGGVYIKNTETVHDRNGVFDWNMNGAIVKTTNGASLSHGSAVQNQNTYLFQFSGLIPKIRNGEFDGQNIASRAIKVYFSSSFEYENIKVHNYLSPANAYARGVGLKFDLKGSNFTGGSITNCTIENIGATSDGNANNSPYGVSKALYFEIYDNGGATATINFSGNTINNVYGDDAEGFLSVKGYGGSYNYQSNNIHFVLNNETYSACQRRAFKVNTSNLTVTNSNITSATNPPFFPGAQATLVHFFSITAGQPIQNIIFSNNTITKIQEAQNVMMGVNDAKDILIDGNTFNSTGDLDLYDFVAFGVDSNQGGLYSGDLENVQFSNNQMNNVGLQILPNYLVPIGAGLKIEDNKMNFDISNFAGGHAGAILVYDLNGSTTASPLTIKNLDINVNMQINGSNLWAILKARQSNITNLTLDNVDVTYTGGNPFHGYADLLADFNSTNTITNCDITGKSGTGAINVVGTAGAIITNSYGDGDTPISSD